MSQNKLGEALEQFAIAIKHAIGAVPRECLVEYFASSREINLDEILSVSEQMEEYELCAVIALAQKQRYHISAN